MANLPDLPAEGSTDWYDHYQAVDEAVRAGAMPGAYEMPSNAAGTPPALLIQQLNTAGIDPATSAEIIQVLYGTRKTFWLNEGGNPRSRAYRNGESGLKVYASQGDADSVPLVMYHGPTSNALVATVRNDGYRTGPGAIRAVAATEPSTTGWGVNDLWLDTSTEV